MSEYDFIITINDPGMQAFFHNKEFLLVFIMGQCLFMSLGIQIESLVNICTVPMSILYFSRT